MASFTFSVPFEWPEDKLRLAAIVELINTAYDVESGDTGVAFKNTRRLHNASDELMVLTALQSQRALVATDAASDAVVGIMVFEIRDAGAAGKTLFFGPFAVDTKRQKTGLGRRFLAEIETVARAHGCACIEIDVVNHRMDILPWYQSHGFVVEEDNIPFPAPERLTRPSHFLILRKRLTAA